MSEVARDQKGIIPVAPDQDSSQFWEGVSRGAIVLPRCRQCGQLWFPPTPGCPNCGAEDHEATECSGKGRVYSWVVVYRSLHEEFADELPYVVATIALDEGPKVFARMFNVRVDAITADMEVSALFYAVDGQALLGFAPDTDEAS
jgi:uncharacterized OB-fold protein